MYGRYPSDEEVKKQDLPNNVVVWCGDSVDISGELNQKMKELAFCIKKAMLS